LLLSDHEVFKIGVYPSDYYYPKPIIDTLRDFAKHNLNVTFGQQGFAHYCPDCYKRFVANGGKEKDMWPDPWHENRCLYNPMKSVDEQADFMQKGKRAVEDVLEISPKIYAPPNHQWDINTIRAAKELGYPYLADRAILNIYPYIYGKLTVLPEKDGLKKTGEIFYVHYDGMEERLDEYLELIQNSDSLNNLKFGKNPEFGFLYKLSLNEKLLIARKRARDLIKRVR